MIDLTNYDATAARYSAFVPGATEIIREPLYDSVTYAAAGQTQLQFFAIPRGQGTSPQAGSGVKSYSDTNMDNAGLLSAGNDFLIETIELGFYPSGAINLEGLDPTDDGATFADDVYTFLKQGALQLFISNKPYLNAAPLGKFPPSTRMYMEGAISDSTTLSTTQVSTQQYASGAGAIFKLSPAPQLVTQNTNFTVTLSWPAVVALPSAATAVVVCTLGGVRYRRVQ